MPMNHDYPTLFFGVITQRRCLKLVLASVALLCPLMGYSAKLSNCVWKPAIRYDVTYNHELSAADNKQGFTITETKTPGDGAENQTVSCKCGGVSDATSITDLTAVGSPLLAGSAGYGKLTDRLDADITGFGNNLASSPSQINIDEYPTSLGNRQAIYGDPITEGDGNVCNNSTRTSRQFRWNAIEVKFLISKPIFGVENIPSQIVAQYYACMYIDSLCMLSEMQHVSDVWLKGSISAPLSCTINAGSVIDIDLGEINRPQFINKGQTPRGYTLRDVDISYHCDDPETRSTTDKIQLTLSSDQGVVTDSNRLIAKMIGRDDVGVRMYDENNNNVVLDGSVSFPLNLDQDGNGHIKMTAAPVSTTDTPPAAGAFEGNVTVKMDIK